MPETNKKQNRRSEKFTRQLFLKIVINNIRDAFGANHILHHKLILRQQSSQYKKENFLAYID